MAFMDFLKKTKKDVPSLGGDINVPPPPPFPSQGNDFPEFAPSFTPPAGPQQAPRGPPQTPDFPEAPPFGSEPFGQTQSQTQRAQDAPQFTPPQQGQANDMLGQPFLGPKPETPKAEMPKQDESEFMKVEVSPPIKSPEELGLGQAENAGDEEKDFGPFPGFDRPQSPAMPEMPPQKPAPVPGPMAPPPAVPQPAPPQQQAEPPEEELEPPPRPMPRIRPKYDFFSREIREAEAESRRKPAASPIFVTMDDFRELLDKSDFVKTKAKESLDTLERISNIGSGMNLEYEKWRKGIAELQKRFLLVDKKIFELG
jgi:hypothetical protein